MNKLFLVLLPANIDRDAVIRTLQNSNTITFWFYCFPSSFFCRSHLTANQIQSAILTTYSAERIFVIQVNSTTDLSGLVPNDQVNLFLNR